MTDEVGAQYQQVAAVLDLLGHLYLRYGKPEKARAYLRLLVKMQPENARVLRALATSELDSGNPSDALPLAQKSLEHTTKSTDRAAGYLLMSRILLALNRPEESFEFSNLYLQEHP